MARLIAIPRRRLWLPSKGGYTFSNADAQAYCAAHSITPSDGWKAAFDNLIGGFNTDGIWAKTDVLLILRNHTEQAALLNAKTASALASSTATFTAKGGIAGNGSSTRVDTGWAPSSGSHYTLNDAGFIFGIDAGADATDFTGNGCATSGQEALLYPWWSGSVAVATINSGSGWSPSNGSTRYGLQYVGRSSSTSSRFGKNGAAPGTTSTSSGSRPTHNFYLGAINNGGTPGNWHDGRHTIFWAGGLLSDAEWANFDTRWDTFISATAGL